jgi:flagellar basal-body rod protein FlgF
MQLPSYIALSSQTALSRQMEVVANNIANLSTPAYKAERMMFQQYLAPRSNDGGDVFVQDVATYRDMRQGPMTRTGNSFDVAIEGSGFFTVSTPEGDRYTRNGHFQLASDGSIMTAQGYQLLDEGGKPLVLSPGASELTITPEGTVSTKDGEIGKIQVVDFADQQQPQVAADGLYVSSSDPTPAQGTKLHQGMVEDSNVQAVVELNRMMNVSRSYTSAGDLINAENDRVKNAIDRLAKIV